MLGKKVIFFEFNEVPLRIIEYYCQKYPNSCLAQKLPQCQQYKTYSPDTILSPWITWATLHRGVPATQHTIHHFGQNLTAIGNFLQFGRYWLLKVSSPESLVHSIPIPYPNA
jgi:hypothetical protein